MPMSYFEIIGWDVFMTAYTYINYLIKNDMSTSIIIIIIMWYNFLFICLFTRNIQFQI